MAAKLLLQLVLVWVVLAVVQAARINVADAAIKQAVSKARNGKKPNFVFILVRG